MTTENIRNLIIADRLSQALDELLTHIKENYSKEKESLKEATILISRLNDLRKQEVEGTVRTEDRGVERNKIRSGILIVLDRLEKVTISQELGESPVRQQTDTAPRPDPALDFSSARIPSPKPPQRLIKAIAEGRVVPMIGAGLSVSALLKGTSNPLMPTYQELLQNLLQYAKDLGNVDDYKLRAIEEDLAHNDTRSAARNLRENIGGGGLEFYRTLRRILNATEQEYIYPSLGHKLLRILNFSHIITTNYDRILEKLVAPNHEVITPIDKDAFHLFTESLINPSNAKYLLKMHGDITRPETILFGEDNLENLYSGNKPFESFKQFLLDVFTKKTVLFLGFSFREESEGYVKLLREHLQEEFGGKPTQMHYALVPADDSEKKFRKWLSRQTGIVFLEYEPDDSHSQVWEFITYLNTAKVTEPEEGRKWSQWYLPNQRDAYLERQLFFEKKARSVRYLTPTLTNALADDEHLRQTSFEKLIKSSLIPENPEQNHTFVWEHVIPRMFDRRNNLVKGLKSKRLEVKVLCLKELVEQEFEAPTSQTINRYRYIMELLNDPECDLEIRLLPQLTSDFLKQEGATYALISSAFPKPEVDVSIAYASQATQNYFNIHMIETNTKTVQEKIFQFERYWASAISEQDTADIIRDLVNS